MSSASVTYPAALGHDAPQLRFCVFNIAQLEPLVARLQQVPLAQAVLVLPVALRTGEGRWRWVQQGPAAGRALSSLMQQAKYAATARHEQARAAALLEQCSGPLPTGEPVQHSGWALQLLGGGGRGGGGRGGGDLARASKWREVPVVLLSSATQEGA